MTTSTNRGVARQLGRIEAAKLVGSVWFLVGIAFLAVFLLMFGVLFRDDNVSTWTQAVQMSPWIAHPFVGMVVFAAYRMTRRPQRDGAAELFTTCPAPPVARTVGLLRTTWVPALTIAVVLLLLGVIYTAFDQTFGPLPRSAVPLSLAAIALGAGGLALGVALAEWAPFPLTPLIAVAAVAAATLAINNAGDPNWNPLTHLSTAPALPDFGPVYNRAPDWWHLVWIVALVVVVASVAVLRHSRSRGVLVVTGVGLFAAAIAAVGVTRPVSGADADLIAARIIDPAAHTTCARTPPVRVCTFAGYEDQRAQFIDDIAPVVAILPTGTREIVVRHTFDGTRDELPPEVRLRLPNGIPALGDREVPLGFESSTSATDRPTFVIALAAMGLPQGPDADLLPLPIDGQARGVVALWLATRGMPVEKAVGWLTPKLEAGAGPFERGSLAVGQCEVPQVVWSQQDLAAARALVRLPEQTVRAVVDAGWDRWTNPATGTDSLLVALGLTPYGAYDDVQPQPGSPC